MEVKQKVGFTKTGFSKAGFAACSHFNECSMGKLTCHYEIIDPEVKCDLKHNIVRITLLYLNIKVTILCLKIFVKFMISRYFTNRHTVGYTS